MDEKQIAELRAFFEKASLPKEIRLNEGIVVTDIPKFINSHFQIIGSGNKMQQDIFLPRLIRLKEMLSVSQPG